MSRNQDEILLVVAESVAPREGRVSRNINPNDQDAMNLVAPREGRVSRNSKPNLGLLLADVAPREGRVSRNI